MKSMRDYVDDMAAATQEHNRKAFSLIMIFVVAALVLALLILGE